MKEKKGKYQCIFENCLNKDPFFEAMIKTLKINSSIKKQGLKRSIKNLIGKCSPSTLRQYFNLTKQYLEFAGIIEYNRSTGKMRYLK
ncbi:MAG: hypothetical protein U9N35_08400 [Euryarchaeota archaeon]|nr:hypothetical protein [Euryarchaeota archaeon]